MDESCGSAPCRCVAAVAADVPKAESNAASLLLAIDMIGAGVPCMDTDDVAAVKGMVC